MEAFGYILAVVMGAVLGLIGGGGSILTVPILVYVLSTSADYATAYSLFVVGVSSLVASVTYYKRGLIDFPIGFTFAVPAFVGVYAVRKYLMPVLPSEIFSISDWHLTKDTLILAVFAVVMILASYSMIRGRKNSETQEKKRPNLFLVTAEGLFVGALTGFVGAGGGFVIVPALVVLAGLDMKTAVGTSLFIITVKSLIGFLGDVQTLENIEWSFLGVFTALSVVGIFVGLRFSSRVDSATLKPAFGWFVLTMGILMLSGELYFS